MQKSKKLVIIGDGTTAEIAYEYFAHDSLYEVVCFSVEKDYQTKKTLQNIPVIALEELPSLYSSDDHEAFVAISYTQLNRLRARLFFTIKNMGYKLASYVSSKSFVWHNTILGENCFIFEDNTIQPFTKIGNNVVLWSGNHIGHHSVIGDHCFISSHVVIAGYCQIGQYNFFGINSSVGNNITIGADNWLGPGTIITKNIGDGLLFGAEMAKPSNISTKKFFKI